MNMLTFTFAGQTLQALGSGALFWPEEGLLCVSDLHLCKSDRLARRGGDLLPPYETRDTLIRLAEAIDATGASTVVCLGDSFDDLAGVDALTTADRDLLAGLQAGRRWIWIEGNHDPGPMDLGGTHLASFSARGLHFRHIASDGTPEVSGHYHPKVKLSLKGRRIARPAFLYDAQRMILPAFGTYTGGLWASDPALSDLFASDARAILTGPTPHGLAYQGTGQATPARAD